jgi:RNA polymerase sigma-70 factor, ECF subfamily
MPVFRNRADLLQRFRAGDRDALEEVYWAYVDKIEKIARHGVLLPGSGGGRVGRRNQPQDLADLVQEVFIKAFAPPARKAYDGLRDYGPFVFTLARNVIVDWARRHGREIPTLSTEMERLADAPALDREDAAIDAADLAIVTAFVNGLSPELRAVHDARHRRGLSQRAAADSLGLSRQTLRTMEQQLRDGLRRALDGAKSGMRG